jgi:hypothetical protein
MIIIGIIGNVEKQPYEEFPIEAGFTKYLVTAETINAGPTVTARNESTGADTTATVLTGVATVNGTKVQQTIRAGVHGDQHLVTFRIVTSLGRKYEAEIRVTVKEY